MTELPDDLREATCPNCGATVDETQEDRCPSCSAPLKIACPNCGERVPVDADECPACGASTAHGADAV
jgi:rRNA maturation endonuclease Nob1